MNQQFDENDYMSSRELENRLEGISLVSPTANYAEIPHRLQVAAAKGRGFWHLLTAGAIACAVVALVIALDSANYVDPVMENQIDPLVAENPLSLTSGTSAGLVGSLDAESPYISGNHYIELTTPVSQTDHTGVEAVAFFWYPCWPCSEFEEYLTDWERAQDDGVSLVRVPVIWSPEMRFPARAYFTAQLLGVLDRSHRQFYVVFEKDNATVTNEQELQRFFETIGISAADFLRAYHSETILQQLEQAEALNRDYQVQSTPALFVGGKYGISPLGAGGFQEMLAVADFLIEGL